MSKKLLSIVIPLFGKEEHFIEKNLNVFFSSITENEYLNNLVEIVLVYKNSDKYNYDFLFKYKKENIKIIKSKNSEIKRTQKTIIGINNSSSKYILIMDPHHKINSEELFKFLSFVSKDTKNTLVFLTNYKIENHNSNETKKVKGKYFEAGSYVFDKEIAQAYIRKIPNLDIVHGDDRTIGSFIAFATNPYKVTKAKNNFYTRVVYSDKENNTTANNENIVKTMEEQQYLFENLLKIFGKPKFRSKYRDRAIYIILQDLYIFSGKKKYREIRKKIGSNYTLFHFLTTFEIKFKSYFYKKFVLKK